MYYEKIDDILPIELFNSLGDLHSGSKYGNKSSLDDDHGHWYKDFTNSLGSTCNLIDISTLLSGQALEIWKHLSGQEFFKNSGFLRKLFVFNGFFHWFEIAKFNIN